MIKPAEKETNFLARAIKAVRIGSATFYTNLFDPNPTTIANIILEEVGPDYAIISWRTNHYTYNNKVNYGETTSWGSEAWGENGQKYHVVRIDNLKPNTKYLFEVMSQNKNYVFDAYWSFETME